MFTNMDHIKLYLSNYFKTGNIIYDMFITSFMIFIAAMFSNINMFDIQYLFTNIHDKLYKRNKIVIEGKKTTSVSNRTWSNSANISGLYSDNFRALFKHIINNLNNKSGQNIHGLKELFSNISNLAEVKEDSIFIIDQVEPFMLDEKKEIFGIVSFKTEVNDDKNSTKIEKIDIEIYSYKCSLNYLHNFVKEITQKYIDEIKQSRLNKQYIYTLTKNTHSDEDDVKDCFSEVEFSTTRTFKNIFFDQKELVKDKVDNFLNNKKWYYELGIPYTMGIGLYGPPGTGKTSFIKALANYTKRHLIVLSFKLIKTKSQLDEFFYESRYSSSNEKNSISFENKIIVFEDIDCASSIVSERSNRLDTPSPIVTSPKSEFKKTDDLTPVITTPKPDDALTLDDILNLFDGLRENSGRIIIITSNYYDKLDKALVRPGRIDITLEMTNLTKKSMINMTKHLYKSDFKEDDFNNYEDYKHTPAYVTNKFVLSKDYEQFKQEVL